MQVDEVDCNLKVISEVEKDVDEMEKKITGIEEEVEGIEKVILLGGYGFDQ